MTQARPPSAAQARGRSKSVLVIDDSDIDRQAIADLLATAGYVVHQLPSPIGATRKARELQVGLVVIDQNLPSLNGNKLAALFRNAGMQDLRVVLTSSSDELAMLEITRQSRADAFVAKQRLRQELVDTVRRLLGR